MTLTLNELDQEIAQLEKSRKENMERAMEEKGMHPFYKFEEGQIVTLTVKTDAPRLDEQNSNRKIFTIIVDGKEYDFSVNMRSPLYPLFIHKLRDAVATSKPCTFKLIRTGKGQKDTRYTEAK